MSAVPSGMALPRGAVLADVVVPRKLVADVALVVGAAALTAASAQISFSLPVPGYPVPFTGQTFAVLLTATALGPLRGTLGQALYVAVGMLGLPVYAGGASGLEVIWGATGGYLVSYLFAAALMGRLAQRSLDRRPVSMFLAFAAGSLVIYAVGVPWLAVVAGYGPGEALVKGMALFLVGDTLKALLAAGALPGAWRLVSRVRGDEGPASD